MINCQPVQIPLYTRYRLSEYYQKVKHKGADFLEELEILFNIKERCPLCGGKDCAEILGKYPRGAVDERGTYYKALPVFRFECKREGGTPIVDHRTFSLLPYQLIPYTKYSIPFIINTQKKIYIEGKSINKVLNYWVLGNEYGTYLDIDQVRIKGFKPLLLQTIDKVLISGYYEEAANRFQISSNNERIKRFIEFSEMFCCYKVEPCIRGPCGLGYDYYLRGDGYIGNSHFLFGTPSQFRKL